MRRCFLGGASPALSGDTEKAEAEHPQGSQKVSGREAPVEGKAPPRTSRGEARRMLRPHSAMFSKVATWNSKWRFAIARDGRSWR
jgi:hypothetical protein